MSFFVMPGVLPGIHVFFSLTCNGDVDGRNTFGYDKICLQREIVRVPA
jgi:hypothetical protein